jgi:hypothetical protein
LWIGQPCEVTLRFLREQHARDDAVSLPALFELLPRADDQLQRREGARAQDRRGNNAAGGDLLLHRQIGAKTQSRRLQHQARKLGDRGIIGVRGACLVQRIVEFHARLELALDKPGLHAKRARRFALVRVGRLQRIHRTGSFFVRLHRPLHGALIDERDHDQTNTAKQRQRANPWMNEEADGDVDRRPWRIDSRHRWRPAQRTAQRVELTQNMRLTCRTAPLALQRRQQHLRREQPVQPARHHQQQAHPRAVQERQHRQTREQHQRQVNERQQAAGRQHSVIDLEHVDGGGEVEQVQAGAEQDHEADVTAARVERGLERTGRRLLFGLSGHIFTSHQRPQADASFL